MGEYLSFKKLITPLLVQVLFWIAVIVNTVEAVFSFRSDGVVNGLVVLIIGPFVIRIVCEAVIVIFEINNKLTEIRDHQRLNLDALRHTPPANPPTPVV